MKFNNYKKYNYADKCCKFKAFLYGNNAFYYLISKTIHIITNTTCVFMYERSKFPNSKQSFVYSRNKVSLCLCLYFLCITLS